MGLSNHLYVVSGSLMRLGQPLIERLLRPGHALICIASQHNPILKQHSQTHGAHLVQWHQDMADSVQAARRLSDWLHLQPSNRFVQAHWIHINDGWAQPSRVRALGCGDIAQLTRSNLETPMALAATFLAGTQHWWHGRKVMVISPLIQTLHAPYRATQTALNEFIELSAFDESQQPNPAKLCCVNVAPAQSGPSDQTASLHALAERSVVHLHSAAFGDESCVSWSA